MHLMHYNCNSFLKHIRSPVCILIQLDAIISAAVHAWQAWQLTNPLLMTSQYAFLSICQPQTKCRMHLASVELESVRAQNCANAISARPDRQSSFEDDACLLAFIDSPACMLIQPICSWRVACSVGMSIIVILCKQCIVENVTLLAATLFWREADVPCRQWHSLRLQLRTRWKGRSA